MASKTKCKPGWHEGPPPSIGWWPASICCDPRTLRWWNGKRWSVACYPKDSAKSVGFWAGVYNTGKETIFWAERPESWPARSKT